MIETSTSAAVDEPSPQAPDDDLLDLAHHMSDLGHPDEALAMAREAVSIYRALTARNPAFAPELAHALVDLATLTSELNWHLAVTPAREALAMYRRLVATDLGIAQEVARPLSDLLTYLAEMSTCQTAPD